VNDPSIGANNFKVQVTGLPPNQNGRLIFGTTKVLPGVPWGDGLRFVGGVIKRLPNVTANGQGVAVVTLDFTQPPLAGLAPGETRFFQFMYKDQAAGDFNTSDALEITFCD
jgi:hypothetical protein